MSAAQETTGTMVKAGLISGLVGSLTIWIYEWIVLHHYLQNSTSIGIVQHTSILVFGASVMDRPIFAAIAGTLIHCATAIVWAVPFAFIWPVFRRRGWEAAFIAIPYGLIVWVIMHLLVLAYLSPAPPEYTVETVIIGLMSHTIAYMVPVAFVVRWLEAAEG